MREARRDDAERLGVVGDDRPLRRAPRRAPRAPSQSPASDDLAGVGAEAPRLGLARTARPPGVSRRRDDDVASRPRAATRSASTPPCADLRARRSSRPRGRGAAASRRRRAPPRAGAAGRAARTRGRPSRRPRSGRARARRPRRGSTSTGDVAHHRRELLGDARVVGVLGQVLACAWRRRSRRSTPSTRLERRRSCCSSSDGGLVADPGDAGDVVGRVALEPVEVGDLLGRRCRSDRSRAWRS